MPKMRYWDGIQWITLDANNADTLGGLSANDFVPKSHIGEGNAAHALATTSLDGFMSKEDKLKLNSIQGGAEANPNVFTTFNVTTSLGTTSIAADSKQDAIEFVAGTGIKLVADSASDQIRFELNLDSSSGTAVATLDANGRVADSNKLAGLTLSELDTRYGSAGHTHPNATTTTAGFMSASDKAALDDIVVNGTTSGTGTAVDFKKGQSTITLTADSNTVTHGITGFNKDEHILLVYRNSVFLQEGVDYVFNTDGTAIVHPNSTGVWPSGAVFDFVGFLTKILPTSDILTIKQSENTFFASGGETNVPIGIADFDPLYDGLEVYHNNLRLSKTLQWELATDQTSINFVGFSLISGDEVTFVVQKKVYDNIENYDGDLNLTSSVQDTNGVYTVSDYKRTDGTLYLNSTLSNPDINGNYQTATLKYYDRAGTTIIKTKTWTLTYDTNGTIVSRSVS